MILLQFRTIFLPYSLCVTEKRTYVNKGCNLENPYLLMVFSTVPSLLTTQRPSWQGQNKGGKTIEIFKNNSKIVIVMEKNF